ncbi:hypothetical protein GGX14DRAFT_399797 [Mycena pura]|uniref:Uncharacterized protein n=1 Tax=Mycena pura TaxID=153505 RepID=A0AAD6V3V1_9AGAR|nr:hypothetical protein GGX14DRAFT_399797 [Mycena pura]
MLSTTRNPVFLASVVVACIIAVTVSAADSVFFSALNCTGTQLQTVDYTSGLCVPSNGAESIELTSDAGATETFVFYTDVEHQNPSFQIVLGPGESKCANILGNIQSVGMF